MGLRSLLVASSVHDGRSALKTFGGALPDGATHVIWLLRNVRHVCDGGRGRPASRRDTVRSETRIAQPSVLFHLSTDSTIHAALWSAILHPHHVRAGHAIARVTAAEPERLRYGVSLANT